MYDRPASSRNDESSSSHYTRGSTRNVERDVYAKSSSRDKSPHRRRRRRKEGREHGSSRGTKTLDRPRRNDRRDQRAYESSRTKKLSKSQRHREDRYERESREYGSSHETSNTRSRRREEGEREERPPPAFDRSTKPSNLNNIYPGEKERFGADKELLDSDDDNSKIGHSSVSSIQNVGSWFSRSYPPQYLYNMKDGEQLPTLPYSLSSVDGKSPGEEVSSSCSQKTSREATLGDSQQLTAFRVTRI